MYHEQMIAVSKIANGFLIEVRAPYKIAKKDKDEAAKVSCGCCISDSGTRHTEEEFFAKDAEELGTKIVALIPLLEKEEFSSEEEFKKSFDDAIK
jgi:hypothetical protein